jgi:phosphopantothenoylcysteine decarboxylase/phosphopantothenate--cysteine ligase
MMLKGKKILLGVTGGIAAYKSALIVRILVKQGAEVKVVMTPDAHAFVTPLTLATLSKNEVYTDLYDKQSGKWNNHVELAMWSDMILIAPATANTIAKMVAGVCDNLLMATYLSAKSRVYIAPAMDLDMYAHPATQRNLQSLQQDGAIILPVGEGELASGLNGAGRMLEPEDIVSFISDLTNVSSQLKGKKVLVTAGPTYENIDPVRFIGNHSSGKMGFALAETFAQHGAQVILITGPTELNTHHQQIKRIDVRSASEMFDKTIAEFKKCQIAVMSAAVADYTPEQVAVTKIKKQGNELHLRLKKTKDILAELGKLKYKKQFLVGFALETDNEIENAKLKLQKKNLDFIVLNSLRTKGAGFGYDTNKVSIIDRNGTVTHSKLKSKTETSHDIVNKIIDMLHE